jgi:hypothetical protein
MVRHARFAVLFPVLVAVVTIAPGAAVAASPPPPAPGTYSILTRHDNSATSLDEFHGSFRVNNGRVTDFHGVVQHQANSGCAHGTTVVVLGSAPIKHLVDVDGTDEWAAAQAANAGAIHVPITLQLRGSRRIHRSFGNLRIYFAGGSDTSDGFTAYSNITFGPTVAGPACNLTFSIG